jgi:hypothetical protein
MTEEIPKIGPCDVCGRATREPLCERCKSATVDVDDALKVFADLGRPQHYWAPVNFREQRPF